MSEKDDYAVFITEERRFSFAHAKRFLERYLGDREFRSAVLSGQLSLEGAAAECGCRINLETLLPVFHPSYTHLRQNASEAEWPLTYQWDQFLRVKLAYRNSLVGLGDSAGVVKEYDLWRQRNISRTAFEIGPACIGIVHAPVAFELASGCSVGCPFCGISAKPFRGHFSLKGEGVAEWRRTLLAVKNVLGRGMRMGFCYWATDPLDNPDYPDFLEIFEEIVGVVPQTTTAIPLRNLDLTKKVLSMWTPSRLIPNRFSVLTTGILKRIHQTFTPEELFGVELVLQNKGSIEITKFRAGKNIPHGDKVGRQQQKQEGSIAGTIACVSGFLINILEKTIRLVSPTMPSTEWPDGYVVFDQTSYVTADEIEGKIREMIAKNMRTQLSPVETLAFGNGIRYSRDGDAACIRSDAMEVTHAEFRAVGELIEKACFTPIQIVEALCRENENPIKVVDAINRLWTRGLLVSKSSQGVFV